MIDVLGHLKYDKNILSFNFEYKLHIFCLKYVPYVYAYVNLLSADSDSFFYKTRIKKRKERAYSKSLFSVYYFVQ